MLNFENVPRLTREQAAIVAAFTGVSLGPFEDMHEYVEKVLGYPVWTHEFADKEVWERLKTVVKPDLFKICAERE